MHTKTSHPTLPFLTFFPLSSKLPFHLAATFFQIHHHKLRTSSIKSNQINFFFSKLNAWTAPIHHQRLSTHTSLRAFASTPPTKNSSFTTSREKLLLHPFPSPSSPTLISTSSTPGSSQVRNFLTPHFIFSSISSNPCF